MKNVYTKNSKTYKLQKALMSGEALTAADALKRFNIKNIRAEATRIRQNGYVVNVRTRKAGNGVIVHEYKMGDASREMIALAYKARRLGVTV